MDVRWLISLGAPTKKTSLFGGVFLVVLSEIFSQKSQFDKLPGAI
jgi:hypothetical protein